MNEENIKTTVENDSVPNTDTLNSEITTSDKLNANTPVVSAALTNDASSTDIRKIKIRTILKERLKNCGLKRAISIVLICLICFSAGIGVDRLIVNHRGGKAFKERPAINKNFQNNRNNGKQFKGMNNKVSPNNTAPGKE